MGTASLAGERKVADLKAIEQIGALRSATIAINGAAPDLRTPISAEQQAIRETMHDPETDAVFK